MLTAFLMSELLKNTDECPEWRYVQVQRVGKKSNKLTGYNVSSREQWENLGE